MVLLDYVQCLIGDDQISALRSETSVVFVNVATEIRSFVTRDQFVQIGSFVEMTVIAQVISIQ